ncbi:MAG TPA: enoyl-CoA hydratase/isomerase family protein [Pseudonocardia sp.]|jgi:enoyl-CoA hydratase|nr:enoyl-CoA hydratase/isomerase family protein [Pseudonocardia sp.]
MIERTDSGSVAVLTMAHGPVNVMDTALLRDITKMFTALAAERPAAVVVTGTGRAFSAGVDLRSLVEGGADYLDEFLPALSEALHTVFTFGPPVVAAVNGHAIAGGCVLAGCADVRLMASGKGRIGLKEFKVGVPFPRVPLEIMVHAVGAKVARRLVMRADTLTPPDALALGLVDEVVEPAELLERAVAAATELATEIPPDTFALTKAQLRRETVDRIARYRVDEDPEVARVWAAHQSDGWIANYLASVTGKG